MADNRRKNFVLRLGIFMVIFCIPFFLILPVIPFFPIPAKVKIAAGTISFIIGETLFWVGGIFVGKELITKFKSYLNPKNWFKKNK